ncbi:MAG: polyphenol oxidase family protein [Bdellovibrionota bacterium]
MSHPFMRKFEEHPLGVAFEDSNVTAFFGDRRSTPDALSLAFPDFTFIGLKQTHSDIVIASPYEGAQPEGDAHFTKAHRVALTIRTADCVPVLIHDPDSGFIAAIHAGWRGVENEIVRKTGARLQENGTDLKRARAWIGPHIGLESFEVGDDVASKLEARLDAVRGHSDVATAIHPHDASGKKKVDLLSIVRAQLRSIGIESERTTEHAIDTFTSPHHESFRRDRERATRQISFIAFK